MVESRRKLILNSMAFLLFSQKIEAYPITKLLGNPSKEFTKSYFKRFLTWYESTWSPLLSKMSPAERTLFEAWQLSVTSFGQPIGNDFFAENFMIRHHLVGKLRLHSTYYCGSPNWDQKLKNSFQNFKTESCRASDFKYFQNLEIFGWSSNFNNQTRKIFFKNLSANGLFEGSKASPLGFVELKDKKIIRRATISDDKSFPFEAHRLIDKSTIVQALQVKDQDGAQSWKLRTKSTFLLPLKTGTMTVAGLHKKEFNQIPDFLDVSRPDEIKIYYP